MFYQAEDSGTINMRARINYQSAIQTDLALSETIGDSDCDSEDSIYDRSTVREHYEHEEENFQPPLLLSESSPNAGIQILDPVSFLSNNPLAEGVGRSMEMSDLEGNLSQKDIQNKQSARTNIPSFRYPAVYGKQSGKLIGALETVDFSSNKLAESKGVYPSRPKYLRNVLETGNNYGVLSGSVERRGQKESTGVLGAPIGTEDPPFIGGRTFKSRDDVVDDLIFGERETDSEDNKTTNRNSSHRLEASKRPAELGFGTGDSSQSQVRAKLRGNGGESIKMGQRGIDGGSMSKLKSSPGSSKGVPQVDHQNAPSGLAELNVSVDSSNLSPRRDRTEKPVKASLSTEEESTTNYLDAIKQAQVMSDRKSHAMQHDMRAAVLRKLNTSVTAIDLCCMKPELSNTLHISTLDIIASKAISQLKRWDKVKSCRMTARELGIDIPALKEIVMRVITRSKVVEPILEIIYQPGVVAELDIQYQGVLSQLGSLMSSSGSHVN